MSKKRYRQFATWGSNRRPRRRPRKRILERAKLAFVAAVLIYAVVAAIAITFGNREDTMKKTDVRANPAAVPQGEVPHPPDGGEVDRP